MSTEQKRIRLGQIGIGHNHGEAKMLNYRKFPELYDVVGFAEEDEEWFKKRGGLRGYEGLPRMSVEELFEKCDAILVETAVPDLTKTAKRCIDAGKHIHLDKPASGTLEEYKAVLDAAKAKNLIVQLGYMYRYNPGIMWCLDMVKSGKLGEIYEINAEMSTFHPKEYKEWLTTFDGGIMYILGSHLIDLVVYLLGEPEKVTSFFKHTKLDGVDFPDNNLSVLEYEKALARVYVSSVEVNGYGRRQFVVAGSEGTISILPIEHKLTVTYANREMKGPTYGDKHEIVDFADLAGDARYDQMAKDFYEYVMGTKVNPFTYEHEYLVQKVLTEVIAKGH